jgi:serine/threonine protein kinase
MEIKSTDPFLGRMIRGYSLEELLGRGRLTAVYRARTEELWQVPELIVTILLVPDTLSEQALTQFKARFMRDARQLALLRHHCLFPLYGYGAQEGLFYLLTPPVQGEILTKRLRQRECWSLVEVLSILIPLAAVLDYLHSQGLVYQFLNPANVILQSDQTVVLSGLGLAQLLSMKGLEKEATDAAAYEHLKSVAGTFLGMPEYLAPEVVKGAEADSRSDIYALGILLFELLNGEPPFTGKSYLEIAQKHVREPLPSLHEISPDLPVALELVINRALHRNPDHRFQTLNEFITAYARVVDERISAPKPMSLVQAIEHMRVLATPKPDETTEWEENNFLLEGKDTLFLEESVLSDTSIASGKEVSTINFSFPTTSLTSFSQEAERSEEQKDVSPVSDDVHQASQTTPVSMAMMVSQLHNLKERLEAQSMTHSTKAQFDGSRTGEQNRLDSLHSS